MSQGRSAPAKSATWRQRLASWLIGPQRHGARLYAGARHTRTTASFGSAGNASADAELQSSLTTLRARSRQMVRDSAFARRAKSIVVNNTIGSGISMQAQVMTTRDALNERVNDDIERAWAEWCEADACHMGGTWHFHDLERAAMGQVFEAGEAFIRLHFKRVGQSRVPVALELVEAERLADSYVDPIGVAPGHELRLGVEVDRYGRPVAYWLRERHSGDIRNRVGDVPDRYERVPAGEVIHLRVAERWPETRGVPMLHSVLRKIDDLNEYTQLEVTAARGSASYFATITSPEPATGLPTGTEADTGKSVMDLEPLTIQELRPGEELQFHAPNRPNAQMDPFLRSMLREIAAGTGTSYESLSRDYSQSNYSSSRLALLDDRDGYKALQQWWIRSFRRPLHRVWLRQAVLARAVSIPVDQYGAEPGKFEAVLFKPRGWSWIDPAKEVAAYKEAIAAGLTTITDVIAATAEGRDLEDYIKTRRRELDMLAEAGIEVGAAPAEKPAAPAPGARPTDAKPEADDDGEGDDAATAARVVQLAARASREHP